MIPKMKKLQMMPIFIKQVSKVKNTV